MSNTPTPEMQALRQSVRRWKTLALALLVVLGLVIVAGGTTALVQLQKARQQEQAARQAEMEARQRAEEAQERAARNLEKAR